MSLEEKAALTDAVCYSCARNAESKAYLVVLAELQRLEHVHVHVVARPDAAELRGTAVFELLKRPAAEWVPDVEMDAFALRIAAALSAALGD